MNRLNLFIIALLVFVIGTSFDQQSEELNDEEVIIANGIAIRMQQFRAREYAKCARKALQVAEIRVDSLVRVGVIVPVVDPVKKPPKPHRPVPPDVKQLPDSINHELLRDTARNK